MRHGRVRFALVRGRRLGLFVFAGYGLLGLLVLGLPLLVEPGSRYVGFAVVPELMNRAGRERSGRRLGAACPAQPPM